MITKHFFSSALAGCTLLFMNSVAVAWIVNDNYDNQAVGDLCGVFWSGPADTKVSSENSASGSNSCKMIVYKGNFAVGGGFVFPKTLNKGDELWMRFRIFFPNGYDYSISQPGNGLKFIRFTILTTSGVTRYKDMYLTPMGNNKPYATNLEGDNCTSWTMCNTLFGTPADAPKLGVWETYEVYVKLDDKAVDQGGTGRLRLWKNGTLVGDITTRPTLNNPTDYVANTKIFSYWNGGPSKNQHFYWDDLVATNVTPSATDSNGLPYIGVGSFVATAAPSPPSNVR